MKTFVNLWSSEMEMLGERDALPPASKELFTIFLTKYPEFYGSFSSSWQSTLLLQQCQRDNKEKQGLFDLLIQPVQRIPRYELIIKVCWESTEHVLNLNRSEIFRSTFKPAAIAEQHGKLLKSHIDRDAALLVSCQLSEIFSYLTGRQRMTAVVGGNKNSKYLRICLRSALCTKSKFRSWVWTWNVL